MAVRNSRKSQTCFSQTFSTLAKKLSMRVQLIESVMIEFHLEWAWTSHQEIATAELLEARAESLLPLTQSSIVLNYLRRHHHKFEKGATTQLLVLCNRTAAHNNAPTPWLSSRTGGRHPCLSCIVGGRCHIPDRSYRANGVRFPHGALPLTRPPSTTH